jgi:hypothetical protein
MISGISQIVRVQLFYGSGEIRYGPEGVDLLLFKIVAEILQEPKKDLGGS